MLQFLSTSAFLCCIYGLFVVAHRKGKEHRLRKEQQHITQSYISYFEGDTIYPVEGIHGSCRPLSRKLSVDYQTAAHLINNQLKLLGRPVGLSRERTGGEEALFEFFSCELEVMEASAALKSAVYSDTRDRAAHNSRCEAARLRACQSQLSYHEAKAKVFPQ